MQSDRVLRREEIYERVWGYAMAHGDRSVDVFVRKLRQKLRAASPQWSYIHTHFGVGYRFAPETTTAARPTASDARRRRRPRGDLIDAAPGSIPRSPADPRLSSTAACAASVDNKFSHLVTCS